MFKSRFTGCGGGVSLYNSLGWPGSCFGVSGPHELGDTDSAMPLSALQEHYKRADGRPQDPTSAGTSAGV